MKRFDFNEPVSKAYDVIDDNVMEIKCGFINLCADIDRFFKLTFNLELDDHQQVEIDYNFKRYFPSLSNISPIALSQLITIYSRIRNVNSHLFLSASISLPSELEEYLSTFPTPLCDITSGGELTIYGMVYILALLSQKHQISSFIVEYFQNRYFYSFIKKETSEIHAKHINYLTKICGKGKPIFNEISPYDKTDVQTYNSTYKKYLIKIFLGIEKCVLNWTLATKKYPQFSYLLYKNYPFSKNKDLTSDIISLRKFCFNGKMLCDEILVGENTTFFTLDYIVSIISKLKEGVNNVKGYEYLLKLIDEFAEKVLHFYLGRMIEESYKLLEKKLFDEEKVNGKIESLASLYSRFKKIKPSFFEKVVNLTLNGEITQVINASRFQDLLPREFISNQIKIVKIKSNSNIKIGEFLTDYNEICLVLVNVEKENLNLINGVSPFEIDGKIEENYSSKIGVWNLTI